MDKNKLKRIADYAVREGTEHTTDGRWSVSYDELYYHFGEEVTDANENGKLLEEELRQREEINELIMTEDAIEMTHIYLRRALRTIVAGGMSGKRHGCHDPHAACCSC